MKICPILHKIDYFTNITLQLFYCYVIKIYE